MEANNLDLDAQQTEDVMSVNHSYLTYTLTKALSRYDQQFSIMPELEFELPTGRVKPDIAICNKLRINWLNDTIRLSEPPLVAIEILSPRPALSDLTDKFKMYFPAGVQSVWVLIPAFREIHIVTPDYNTISFHKTGLLRDPATGLELDLDETFA